MKLFKLYIILILSLTSGYSQDKPSFNFGEKIFNNTIEFENELITNSVKVKVLSTCSTEPNLCGISAFGSISLVQILNGKYINQVFYIATICEKTNYELEKTYNLKATLSPGFSVILCDGKIYNTSWNNEIETNKYLMFFGSLK